MGLKRSMHETARAGGRWGIGLDEQIAGIEKSGFVVDVDDADSTIWTIAIDSNVLLRLGLNALVGELSFWAYKYCKAEAIVLEVRFQDSHPGAPPFVRVVRPRFSFDTGYVTHGGSIRSCLLEDQWRLDATVKAMLRCICENFKGGGAKLELTSSSSSKDYTLTEARDGYRRAASQHD